MICALALSIVLVQAIGVGQDNGSFNQSASSKSSGSTILSNDHNSGSGGDLSSAKSSSPQSSGSSNTNLLGGGFIADGAHFTRLSPDSGAGCGVSNGCGNLTYHGGPVVHSPADFLIFWLPPGYNFDNATIDPTAIGPSNTHFEQLLVRFFTDICLPNPFYGIIQQYTDASGPPGSCSYGGSWVDTSSYTGGRGSSTNPLTDADIQGEVLPALTVNGWTSNNGNNLFLVYTGYNVYSCRGTNCSFVVFCAYHGTFNSGSVPIRYSNMPDQGTLLNGCGAKTSPNNDIFADSEISTSSHEQFETFTDPDTTAGGNGWFYQDGGHEIGDECAGIFVPNTSSITIPTIVIGANPYRLQWEWSNIVSGCLGFNPDFRIYASPTSPSMVIVQGSAGTETISLSSLNGFAGDVRVTDNTGDLKTVTLGAGATFSFTFPLTAGLGLQPGQYGITVTATSQSTSNNPGISYTVSFPVTVVIPEQAPVIAVADGTDGNLYWNMLSPQAFPQGTWSGWQSLSHTIASSPALCSSGSGRVDLVIRGIDNAVYHRAFIDGSWSQQWDTAGGSAGDVPACAVVNNSLFVVVRGLDNSLSYNELSFATNSWLGWASLNGGAASAPVLASSPTIGRLDLVIQGTDNQVYHKSYASGVWSPWDTPGGSTNLLPAAVSNGTSLHVVVTGSDSSIYYNVLSFTGGTWAGWIPLNGSSPSAPSLTIDSSGTLHLVVRGSDNSVYHKSKLPSKNWSLTWDSPGGSISGTPVTTPIGSTIGLLVVGGSNFLYFNRLVASSWSGWTALNLPTGGLSPELSTVF